MLKIDLSVLEPGAGIGSSLERQNRFPTATSFIFPQSGTLALGGLQLLPLNELFCTPAVPERTLELLWAGPRLYPKLLPPKELLIYFNETGSELLFLILTRFIVRRLQ